MENEKLPTLEETMFKWKSNPNSVFDDTNAVLSRINYFFWLSLISLAIYLYFYYVDIFATKLNFFSFFFMCAFNWFCISGIRKLKQTFLFIKSHIEKAERFIDSETKAEE